MQFDKKILSIRVSCFTNMRSDCFLIVLLFLSSFLALAYSFECEGNEGVLADPEDCRAFYVCDSYHSEHYSCGETLLFDEKFLVCNFDYVVDCGDRPIPGVSTTSTPLPITTTSSGRKQQFVSLENSVPCVPIISHSFSSIA